MKLRLKSQKSPALMTGMLLACVIVFGLHVQDASADDIKELQKQSANPIAKLISLPFQFNFNFGLGDYDRGQTVINIQPVLPVTIFKGRVNMINRIITPLVYQPDVSSESGGTFGIGNTSYSMFFTPAESGALIWGVGPAFNIPTASAPELGGDAFGIGPTAIALTMPGRWVLGGLLGQVWSYKTSELSQFYFQYFITYNLPKGWFINTLPMITANWNAPEGERWSVPFGAGFGRVVALGGQPVRFQAAGYWYAVSPTGGPEWSLQAQVTLLFPK
jgi:hypothetical protein